MTTTRIRRPNRTAARLTVAMTLAVTALLLPGTAGVATAAHIACGATISASTILTHDIGPCSGTGLTVTGIGVTLNLGGNKVFGAPGSGAGILVQGDGATVTNGTVENFAGGVTVRNRYGVTVSNLLVQDNFGGTSAQAPGEGIGLWNTIGTTVRDNTVVNNGPYGGIAVYGTSSGNTISGNTVTDNNADRSATVNENIGIRLEPLTTANVVVANTVTGSGLDGISSFGASEGNTIRGNDVRGNGGHSKAHRQGDGIRLNATGGPSTANTVEGNTVCANAADGIAAHSAGNTIIGNTSGSGSGCSTHGPVGWDLADYSSSGLACGNAWLLNAFTSRNVFCIN